MATAWKTINTIATLSSPWVDIIVEKLIDDKGDTLDYWRVEKDDSAIVIPFYKQDIILPKSLYRPGIQKFTYDFPGGRIKKGENPEVGIKSILQNELKIREGDIERVVPINTNPWIINSSFSNQLLHGFIAELSPEITFPDSLGIERFNVETGVNELLEKMECLQCRALLLEWRLTNGSANKKW